LKDHRPCKEHRREE
jgi:hypothetical protein